MDADARYAFRPDPGRAHGIDAGICQKLGESLQAVAREAGRAGFEVDGDLDAFGRRIAGLTGAPPQLWACYHDLVQAAISDDHLEFRSTASDMLSIDLAVPVASAVVTLEDADLGANNAARYRRIIDSDLNLPLNLQVAPVEEVERMQGLVGEARRLLGRACPDLAAEVHILGHQVVLAASGPGANVFGGAASIFLWGAVVCNPNEIRDRLAMVESLTHETAHALLFGMTFGEDLTLNDPGERYPSPLRVDLRPIEGIVHATYVLGRMIYLLDECSRSGLLTAAERDQLAGMQESNLRLFRSGAQTIRQHARFTEAGRVIFGNCHAAIEAQHGSS